jgi:hypothetical protein
MVRMRVGVCVCVCRGMMYCMMAKDVCDMHRYYL